MSTFPVADSVYGIDLQMFDSEVLSAYLIDAPELTLIETGYAKGTDRLISNIEELGFDPRNLKHAIATHVHIDHIGGASGLQRLSPDINVYLHESTADFLHNPGPLNESSERAMGAHYNELGGAEPIPSENVHPVSDGDGVKIGDRTLEIVHAPGHSPDHTAVWDSTSGWLFAGEGLGSYYPRIDEWLPPATLPQFDVEAANTTIDRLDNLDPDHVALSHFGVVPDPDSVFSTAESVLLEFNERIPALYSETGDVEEVIETIRNEIFSPEGVYDEKVADFEIKFQVQGFLRYHDLL